MLADNLILLRDLKGLTQEQAAEIAGVTRQSYSKWEQGETVPDIEKCDRLARHYGVTLDALLHDQNRVGHTALAPAPAGKHLWGAVTLGARGQIVIPKAAREMFGLKDGEHILHTAHRTTTSRAAWERLKKLLEDAGIPYKATGAIGMESIRLIDGKGRIDFRTRSSKGGLGEGFDLLIIDEAQEYQDDQETALKYVVSDSKNPQTIFCGTPPTPVSSGTVFMKLRDAVLQGTSVDTGWAEWSVE